MRIGMILDKTFPPDPRVQNEATALLKNGHEVLLFCLHYGDRIAYEKMEGFSMKKALMVACLMFGLFAFMSCASTDTTSQEKKKPVGWGTINTIESESTK